MNPIKDLLQGKKVILIDDSVVRGTTSRKIVEMVRFSGALEIHMRISSPPTISPCYYGIDTPTHEELIGANKTVEEIREFTKADTLAYLSIEGMKEAVKFMATKEGILLDPVYSGKGFDGLMDLVSKKYFKDTDKLLFIHTGGAASLHAYEWAF